MLRASGPDGQSRIELSFMHMYIFCFRMYIVDFSMATANTTMITAKKVIKGSPYKWAPKTP